MKITEFAKQITNCTVAQKQEAHKKIKGAINSGIAPDGSPMTPTIMRGVKALEVWLSMNILIGEELCPADTVTNYYD